MADISKITIPNGSGTNTYDLKDSEAREGLLSTVKYTEQSLTSEQQVQARENIGAAASDDIPTDAVKYTEQDLTTAQKTQARENIGAGTSNFSGDYRSLTNAPPLAINGGGTGGDIIGGTGVNENSTRYTNSVAYGALASAIADHAFAFGNHAFAGSNYGGKHAVAIGNNVRAQRDYEWAIGKFNQSNADTAFSIGDGTSENDRHNLLELKTDGRMFLNGNAVKTEGGDDNKLRLGQIVSNNGKYGIANLYNSNQLTSITFQTTDVPISSFSANAIIGIFGDFLLFYQSGIKFAPIAGYTGISKTGQWIHAENCYAMFLNCAGSITSLDVSMLDTSEVKNMGYMFSNCTKLTSLDLSTFDTSNVENMYAMFLYCTDLKTLDISSFDMTNVIAYDKMFGEESHWAGITTLKTPKINPLANIPLPRTLYSQDGTAYTRLPVTTGTSIELRKSWT